VYKSNSISLTDSIMDDSQAVPTPPPPHVHVRQHPKWKQQLLKHYVIASSPSSKLFELNVAMQTTDTGEVFASKALLGCGATDLFANSNFIRQNWLITRTLSCPIPVYNVDGTLNKAGSISEVWEAILQYQDHSKCATFAVTGLGKQDIILRLAWLHEHNPKSK
jgi:hypothetical protein